MIARLADTMAGLIVGVLLGIGLMLAHESHAPEGGRWK